MPLLKSVDPASESSMLLVFLKMVVVVIESVDWLDSRGTVSVLCESLL